MFEMYNEKFEKRCKSIYRKARKAIGKKVGLEAGDAAYAFFFYHQDDVTGMLWMYNQKMGNWYEAVDGAKDNKFALYFARCMTVLVAESELAVDKECIDLKKKGFEEWYMNGCKS